MNLHELMGTAVADLPELPDQLPAVARRHHRRTATKRAALISVSTALVLGVGTLTIASPWARPSSRTTVAVAGSSFSPRITEEQFGEYTAQILQRNWPVKGQKVTWDPSKPYDGYGNSKYEEFQVSGGGKSWEVGLIFYGRSTTEIYPIPSAPVDTVPSDCVPNPSACTSNADHSMYAEAGLGGSVYVTWQGKDMLTLWTRGLPSTPTERQLQQLALAEDMKTIYVLAGQAGLLVPETPAATVGPSTMS